MFCEYYPGAISIALGSTSACVGVSNQGVVEIVPNEYGNRTSKCFVLFTDTGTLIGDSAYYGAVRNPENAVFDLVHLFRRFDDSQKIENWPFAVVNLEGKPVVRVEVKGQYFEYSPSQLLEMIFAKLKKDAEEFLGMNVQKAVLSVPISLEDERNLIMQAAQNAGLEVVRILDDPTSACLAYGLLDKVGEVLNVLVFHLGGANCSSTLLTIDEGVVETKLHCCDENLGGRDFDEQLVQFLSQELHDSDGMDVLSSTVARKRLRLCSERAKKVLSSANQTTIEIDSLMHGTDVTQAINRRRFEVLNADLFRKCLELVKKTVLGSGLSRDQIHEVILIGGSSRIPKIQQLISDYFNGKHLRCQVNPDEAVAFGAAIHASILTGVHDQPMPAPTDQRLTDREIQRMIDEASWGPVDHELRDRVIAKNSLEMYCYEVKNALERQVAVIQRSCDEMLDWIEAHLSEDGSVYEENQVALTTLIRTAVSKIVDPPDLPPFRKVHQNIPTFEELDVD